MWPMIDILKIDPTFRTEKSALRAIPQNRELNEIFEQLVDDINIEKKELSRKLKVNISSIHNWCAHGGHIEKHPIPIWVLNWMIETSRNNEIRTRINELIEAIRCGRTGTVQKFPRHLTPEVSPPNKINFVVYYLLN